MFNLRTRAQPHRDDGLPFLRSTRIRPGEKNELVLGPSVAKLLRWVILAALILSLARKGSDSSALLALLRWFWKL